MVGRVVAGRYRLEARIGEGGMGLVYRARHVLIDRVVAIKLIRPDLRAETHLRAWMLREAKAANRVDHAHIIDIHDIGETEEGELYLVMEYLVGTPLSAELAKGPMPITRAVDIIEQMCAALARAHDLGVVHRDLKSDNILLTHRGGRKDFVKILDFGLAALKRDARLAPKGAVFGTPEYMSPEQAEAREVDARSDIYSLGVILFEMVTGRVPFEGETPLSVAIKQKSEPPRDPRELNNHLSPALSRIVLKCLAKAKADRYQSAAELGKELEALEKGFPTPDRAIGRKRPTTTREVTIKFDPRRTLVPVLAALLVVAAAFFGGRLLTKKGANAGGRPAAGGTEPPASHVTEERNGTAMRLFAPLLGEAVKNMDPKEFRTLERTISAIQEKVPANEPLNSLWNDARKRFDDGQKQQKAGDLDASRKSYTRSQSEMNRLLVLVNDKEAADQARGEMESSRKAAGAATATKGDNILHWIAGEKLKDAEEAYRNNDFSGARTLYAILRKVYVLSVPGGAEEACLVRLQGLVRDARREADTVKAAAKGSWLYERAREEEARAVTYLTGKQYAEAAEFLVLSAFLYEKSRDVSLESTGPGD